MTIISFFNQKGGCGKSTSTVHFACWLRFLEYSVIVIDSDAQRSSSIWLNTLVEPVDVVRITSADEMLNKISAISHEYDFTLIDCPAGISEITRTILLKTDAVIIPCQPSGIDLWSTTDTVQFINQIKSIRNGQPDSCIFLSKAIKGTNLKSKSLQQLYQLKTQVLESCVHQRQIIAEAFNESTTVWDISQESALESRREFHYLFSEILVFIQGNISAGFSVLY